MLGHQIWDGNFSALLKLYIERFLVTNSSEVFLWSVTLRRKHPKVGFVFMSRHHYSDHYYDRLGIRLEKVFLGTY